MRRPPDKNGQPALSERDVDSSNATLNTLFGGSRQKPWMISPGAPVRPSPRRAGLFITQDQLLPLGQSAAGSTIPAPLENDESNLPRLHNPRESSRNDLRHLLSSPEDGIQNPQSEAFQDRQLPQVEDDWQVQDLSGAPSGPQINDLTSRSCPNAEHQLQSTSLEPTPEPQPQSTTKNISLPPSMSHPTAYSDWSVAELRSPSPLEPDFEDTQSANLINHLTESLNSEPVALPQMSNYLDPANVNKRVEISVINHNRGVNDMQNQTSPSTQLNSRHNTLPTAMSVEQVQSAANTQPNPYKRQRTHILNLGSLKSRVPEIDNHIEAVGGIMNLGTGLERPRFQLLKEACDAEDDFYVALHQIFCAWSCDRAKVIGISDFPPLEVLQFAFKALGQLIRDNGQLAPVHLKWFSQFPNPLPDILRASEPYRWSVRNVGKFLSKLATDWIPFSQECSARGYPPLVDELITRMLILSPILRGVMFTATRRNLGINDETVGARMEEIHRKDRYDHQTLSARVETAQPPTRREIYDRNNELISAYSNLLNQTLHHHQSSSSLSRIPTSLSSESVHMAASQRPGNNLSSYTQPDFPRPVSSLNGRVAAPDGSVQVAEGRQQSRATSVRSPGSGVFPLNWPSSVSEHRLHQTNARNSVPMYHVAGQSPRPATQSQPVLRSNGRENELVQTSQDYETLDPYVIYYRKDLDGGTADPSSSIRSRPAETTQNMQQGQNTAEPGRADQHSHVHPPGIYGSYAFTAQQPRQVDDAFDPARYPSEIQQAENQQLQQLPQQQQQFPMLLRSYEVQRANKPPQRVVPLVNGVPESARRGSIRGNSHNHVPSRRHFSNQNLPTQHLPRVHLLSNTQTAASILAGDQVHAPAVSRPASSNTPMSPALPDQAYLYGMMPPMQRSLIPPLGFVHPVQSIDPQSTALHQAHLRSPRLVPEIKNPPGISVDESGRRFYQVIKGFVRDPSYISGSEPLFTYDFFIPEADYGSIAQDELVVVGDIAKRVFTTRTLQYRLRCVKRPKKELTCTTADWVVSDTRWPEYGSFNIQFGAAKHQLEIRRKSHYGKDLPIDLTGYLRLVGSNTKTRITLATPGRRLKLKEASYFLAIEVIEILSHKDTVDTCLKSQHRPASETLDAIKKSLAGGNLEDDDDIAMVTTDLSIELADPFTARIFDVPVRGNSCLHRECFDLDTFLLTRNSKPGRPGQPSMIDVWRCPLCGRDARPVSLHIDDFLVGVRAELKDKDMLDVKAILINQNGHWRPKEEEKTGTGKRKAVKDASGSEDDQPKKANVVQSVMEVINLDDD